MDWFEDVSTNRAVFERGLAIPEHGAYKFKIVFRPKNKIVKLISKLGFLVPDEPIIDVEDFGGPYQQYVPVPRDANYEGCMSTRKGRKLVRITCDKPTATFWDIELVVERLCS